MRRGADARPLLSPAAAVRDVPTGVAVASGAVRLTLESAPPSFVRDLVRRLGGADTVAGIAAALDAEPAALAAVLAPLAAADVVLDLDAAAAGGEAEAFLDAFFAECRFWNRIVFAQPFWRRLEAGRAGRTRVLGYGIEFTRFVEAADRYMPLGVARSGMVGAERERLARHYLEEAGHSEIFFAGLVACGLDPDALRAAPPLAGTQALTGFLEETAMAGGLGYPALFALMQPLRRAADPAAVAARYARLRDLYPQARGLWDAFERHDRLDADLAHGETDLEALVRGRGRVDAGDAARAVAAVRGLAEHFVLFFEAIDDHYGRPGATPVRRPARLAMAG